MEKKKKTRKAIKEGGVKTVFTRANGKIKEKVFHIKPITPEDVERKHKELQERADFEAAKVKLKGERLQLIADREKLEADIKELEEEKRIRGEIAAEKSKFPPMVDVLFINGCDSSVPHPARYRVTHQREQLAAFNVTSDEVYYVDLQVSQVKYAQLFVFFRCPYTDTIGEFVELAKKLNKTVLFDIDDLVVDTKYTNQIKYISDMTVEEKAVYDDGVNRMGHTLKICEGAITTTKRLAEELGHYVPETFINRNTASERMYMLSETVERNRDDDEIRIGYFSGSITHNDDFLLVKPALINLLDKYDNLRLYIVGELELPEDLAKYKEQIVINPFMDWEKLPQLISEVDINIAPLEQSIFNEAKSENKWVEAALVKVPTVASDVGAFTEMITDGENGFLCKDDDWETVLDKLINDAELRNNIALNAYEFVKKNCLTLYSGKRIADYINSKFRPSIAFCFPSTEISGGIMVALKHASMLQDRGFNVTIIADKPSLEWMEYEGHKFPVLSYGMNDVFAYFDKAVATMWTTTPFVETHPKIRDRYYIVQNYEVDFYEPDSPLRIRANQTYNLSDNIKYLTISKWCQNWLKDYYDKDSKYAPNGIDLSRFTPIDRDFSGKIRILIEGDCAVEYKRVDESFEITNKLDRDKYEVWYMSYNEKPKDWYKIDKFLHRVPYDEVPDVYKQCHILLKSSSLESFSYPPLEMMATGGCVVVAPNGGNVEYIKDGYNCLTYDHDIDQAIQKIEYIVENEQLREELRIGALKTSSERDWKAIENQIVNLYDV